VIELLNDGYIYSFKLNSITMFDKKINLWELK